MDGFAAFSRTLSRMRSNPKAVIFRVSLIALVLTASCGKQSVVFEAAGVTDPLDNGGSSGGDSVSIPGSSSSSSPATVQQCSSYSPKFSRRVWRLTGPQYVNSVKAVFPGVTNVGNPFANNSAAGAYNNNSNGLHISKNLTENLITETEKVAPAAAASLKTSYPCLTSALNEECVSSVVEGLGLRLFRRPLTLKETVYFGNFLKSSVNNFNNDGVAIFIQAMLMSPNFLFRYEVGDPSTGLLSSYEKASLIAYSAANTSPDSELLDAAKNNELSNTTQIKNQFIRFAKKHGNYESVIDFFRQYLRYDLIDAKAKDANLFPDFSPAIGKQLVKETDALIIKLLNSSEGTFEELFSTSTVMASPLTAHIYGVNNSGKNGVFETTDNKRAGILSQPSFLASVGTSSRTSPVALGKRIRYSLLCTTVGAPPPDVITLEASARDQVFLTQRAQLAVHSSKASCFECHKFMDPLGLGFEGFDATGKLRELEGGLPVDDRGEINFTRSAIDGPFKGNKEIAYRLSTSEIVRSCFLKNSYLYLAGQADETNANCFVKKVQAAGGSSGNILDNFGVLYAEFLMAPREGSLGAPDNSPTPGSVAIVLASSSSSLSSVPPPPPAPVVFAPSPPTITVAPLHNSTLPNTITSVRIAWTGGSGIYLTRLSVNNAVTSNDNETRQEITFNVVKGASYRFWIHSRKANFSYQDATSFGISRGVDFKVAP